MIIKRSISPDGCIDSLSIEVSASIGKVPTEEIKVRAEKTLHLQSEIVDEFLNGNGKKSKESQTSNSDDSSVPARMLSIGSMNGKWGRRLFINVQVNGQISKLFGNRKQLAEFIADAGFLDLKTPIEEGTRLEISCRVITKPSDDGKYLNIHRVFPIPALRAKAREAK